MNLFHLRVVIMETLVCCWSIDDALSKSALMQHRTTVAQRQVSVSSTVIWKWWTMWNLFFSLLLCQLLSSFTFVLSHSSIKVCQQLLDSYCEISTDSHGSDYNLSCNDFSLPHFSPRASSDFSNLSTRRVKLAVSVATREFPLGWIKLSLSCLV